MLRPTPRLPTASVVDRVFKNLGIEDDGREDESVGEAFDPEGLTEAELIEAHYMGLLDLGNDTGVRDARGVAPPKGAKVTKGHGTLSGRDLQLAQSVRGRFKDKRRWYDLRGSSIDALHEMRGFGIGGERDYDPPKASNTVGAGDLGLTLDERILSRILTLQAIAEIEKERYRLMGDVFPSTGGTSIFAPRVMVTGAMLVSALEWFEERFKGHERLIRSKIPPSRGTRAMVDYDAVNRVQEASGRGGAYMAKAGTHEFDEQISRFELAVRYIAAHPEVRYASVAAAVV